VHSVWARLRCVSPWAGAFREYSGQGRTGSATTGNRGHANIRGNPAGSRFWCHPYADALLWNDALSTCPIPGQPDAGLWQPASAAESAGSQFQRDTGFRWASSDGTARRTTRRKSNPGLRWRTGARSSGREPHAGIRRHAAYSGCSTRPSGDEPDSGVWWSAARGAHTARGARVQPNAGFRGGFSRRPGAAKAPGAR
jgi:hypothetical protein